jgi:hypothetical protein
VNEKKSKRSVNYEPVASMEDHCAQCVYYQLGKLACTKVEGTIRAEAWCKLFEPSTEAKTPSDD